MLKYLMYILVALLPLSTELAVTNTLSLDFPFEPILIILSFITVLLAVNSRNGFKLTTQTTVNTIIALQLFWYLINILFSTNPLLSLKFTIAKCWYILPFCILLPTVIQDKTSWKKLTGILCVSTCMLVVVTMARHASYHFSFIGINKSVAPFFRNHVNYSALLVCLLPTIYIFYTQTKRGTKTHFISFVLLFIALPALALSYSRGAWLALLVGIIAYQSVKRNLLKSILAFIAIITTGAIIYLSYNNRFLHFRPNHDQTVFHPKLSDHLQATIYLRDVSNGERIYRWIAAANMIVEKPLTGFGTNSFYPTYKSYTIPAYKTWVSNNPDHSTVHNYFLLTLVEQGVPGLLLLVFLLLHLLFYCQKIYSQTSDPFHQSLAIGAATTLCMVICLNCFSDLIETDKVGAVFWLIVSVVITLQIQTKKTARQHSVNN